MTTLAEKVVALEGALVAVPHAFGGALALAYYAEPRATIDIDLNVFVPATEVDEVRPLLVGVGVDMTDDVASVIARDGQARAFWDGTPVDLFFAYDAFHESAAGATRVVPFADRTITILGPEHLVVCKVVFDRPKDWLDIDAMRSLGTTLDAAEVLRWVGRIAGDDDPRFDRIAAVLAAPPS